MTCKKLTQALDEFGLKQSLIVFSHSYLDTNHTIFIANSVIERNKDIIIHIITPLTNQKKFLSKCFKEHEQIKVWSLPKLNRILPIADELFLKRSLNNLIKGIRMENSSVIFSSRYFILEEAYIIQQLIKLGYKVYYLDYSIQKFVKSTSETFKTIIKSFILRYIFNSSIELINDGTRNIVSISQKSLDSSISVDPGTNFPTNFPVVNDYKEEIDFDSIFFTQPLKEYPYLNYKDVILVTEKILKKFEILNIKLLIKKHPRDIEKYQNLAEKETEALQYIPSEYIEYKSGKVLISYFSAALFAGDSSLIRISLIHLIEWFDQDMKLEMIDYMKKNSPYHIHMPLNIDDFELIINEIFS